MLINTYPSNSYSIKQSPPQKQRAVHFNAAFTQKHEDLHPILQPHLMRESHDLATSGRVDQNCWLPSIRSLLPAALTGAWQSHTQCNCLPLAVPFLVCCPFNVSDKCRVSRRDSIHGSPFLGKELFACFVDN